MYRRPKFLEVLLEIRCEMAVEADYDVDLFAEIVRSGNRASKSKRRAPAALSEDPPLMNGKAPKLSRSRGR